MGRWRLPLSGGGGSFPSAARAVEEAVAGSDVDAAWSAWESAALAWLAARLGQAPKGPRVAAPSW